MGTGPTTGASCNHSTPISVPTTSAANGPGTYFDHRGRQSVAMASDTEAMATALKFTLASTDGKALTESFAPPASGAPKNGST